MRKNLKILISSLMIALTYAPYQVVRAMEKISEEKISENHFNRCAQEITVMILRDAAFDQYFKPGHTKELASVCRNWFRLINDKSLQEYCQNKIFLNGKFIYMSDDKSMISQAIKDYENPFNIIFDLQHTNAAKKVLITTDPSCFFGVEHENKIMILISTRSFIEKNLESIMCPFAPIMSEWNRTATPVGIFWKILASQDLFLFYYIINKDIKFISSKPFNDHVFTASMHVPQTNDLETALAIAEIIDITSGDIMHITTMISCSFCELK